MNNLFVVFDRIIMYLQKNFLSIRQAATNGLHIIYTGMILKCSEFATEL